MRAILKVIMQQASCLTRHTSAFSFTAAVPQQHPLLQQYGSFSPLKSSTVRTASILHNWFKGFFIFLYHGEHCIDSSTCTVGSGEPWKEGDDSEMVGGLRPGETLEQQMGRFSASLHHAAGGSPGDEHLLSKLTCPTQVPYIFCSV